MFVVNFDFSDHLLPLQLLAINIPVAIAELITYPLQRMQTLLISESRPVTVKQTQEISLILRNMVSVEGFPKLLHGMRYSVDYMGTQMTTRFLLFEYLNKWLINPTKQMEKWKIISACLMANLTSTIVSQIAFNYMTIAASLPISKSNRPEDVKIKLQNYTRKNKFPVRGLKYTLPVSFINTGIQLFVLSQAAKITAKNVNISYLLIDFLTALSVFSTTAFISHYAFQRQVEICKQLPETSIPYSRGLLGSFLRYNIKGLTLFGLYTLYFEAKAKSQIENMYEKRIPDQKPMPYRQ